MLCRICIVQIQHKEHVLDHAEDTAPTRQHELDHTGQEYICPEKSTRYVQSKRIGHQDASGNLSDV